MQEAAQQHAGEAWCGFARSPECREGESQTVDCRVRTAGPGARRGALPDEAGKARVGGGTPLVRLHAPRAEVTEDQARAVLAAFDAVGGLEPWVAAQRPWQATLAA